MSQQEASWQSLDSDFDHFLAGMKPYVLKLPNKTDRQRCAMWIKKLCDPGVSGSSLAGRTTRNVYARLLQHMLKNGFLDAPFTSRPEPGSLKMLPTYMSIYFDEPLGSWPATQTLSDLPEWVTGELGGHLDDAWESSLLKNKTGALPTSTHTSPPFPRWMLHEDKSPSRHVTSSPLKHSPREKPRTVEAGPKRLTVSPDDSDLEDRLNSWNLGIENPRYLRERPIPLSPILKAAVGRNNNLLDEHSPLLPQSKEVEMKIKVLEAKRQEEKLMLQPKRDTDVQKILDRKNGEIEGLKTIYQAKQKESEEIIRELGKKVESTLQESQVIRESKEKQIAELKKMLDLRSNSLKNEWEKKEKFELQRKHTEDLKDVLKDTNRKLAKVDAEYSAQEQRVRELELRLKQQSVEVEKANAVRQKLTQEKAQLELHVAAMSAELQEANRRSKALQQEKQQQSEQHQQTLQKLQAKHEMDISHFQQEHTLSLAKASDVIEDWERSAAQLRQQLQDSEQHKHKQLRDQENKFQQEQEVLQMDCEKKIQGLHNEADRQRREAKKKISKLEDALREAGGQLDRTRDAMQQQAQQAESSLEQYKKQVELSSEKTYNDMKLKMEKVAAELTRSESLRESQTKEFSQQLNALRQRQEQQMAEQRVQQEQERTRLQQQCSAERDGLVQERQREVSRLEKEARAALQQHQQHTQEWRRRDAKTILDLENQVSSLRGELQAAHGQRKKQLAEEKRRAAQEHEASLGRLRAERGRILSDMEKKHQQEKEAAEHRANSRLKQLEKDSNLKFAKSAQVIAQLQASLCDSKEETVRLQHALERQLEEANTRWEQERWTMTQHSEQTSKALQENVGTLQRQLHSSERKMLNKELEMQQQVTAVRQECEVKIRGLMPAALQQELENTIASLKAQVHLLQKRASLLQEDLDACRSSR